MNMLSVSCFVPKRPTRYSLLGAKKAALAALVAALFVACEGGRGGDLSSTASQGAGRGVVAVASAPVTAGFQVGGYVQLPGGLAGKTLVAYVRDEQGNIYDVSGLTLTPPATRPSTSQGTASGSGTGGGNAGDGGESSGEKGKAAGSSGFGPPPIAECYPVESCTP